MAGLRPGVTLPGGFEVVRRLGHGAFAVVWEGRSPSGQRVAIKAPAGCTPHTRALFRREVELLAMIGDNPNVAAYCAHGDMEDDEPFLVMEFIEGYTLARVLKTREPGDEEYACRVLLQLCGALAELHALGVAHCDIKPPNIMVETSGDRVVLLDLGLAQDTQGLVGTLQRADLLPGGEFRDESAEQGIVAGTPDYLSPEQIADARVADPAAMRTEAASDVFALGVLAHRMLAGVTPFPIATFKPEAPQHLRLREYLRWRFGRRIEDLTQPDTCSDALWSIITRALHHDPKMRQPDARALAGDLERYLATGAGVAQREGRASTAVGREPVVLPQTASAPDVTEVAVPAPVATPRPSRRVAPAAGPTRLRRTPKAETPIAASADDTPPSMAFLVVACAALVAALLFYGV